MQSDFEKRKKLKEAISSLLFSLTLVISAVVAVYSFNFGKRITVSIQPPSQPPSVPAFETEMVKIRADLDRLKGAAQALPTGTPSQLALEVQQATSNIKALDSRLASLETAILANPAKALQIPLIQRDIDGLRLSQQAASTYLKESVDRIYDLNKWLLGGLAVSIITLALSTFFRSKTKSSE